MPDGQTPDADAVSAAYRMGFDIDELPTGTKMKALQEVVGMDWFSADGTVELLRRVRSKARGLRAEAVKKRCVCSHASVGRCPDNVANNGYFAWIEGQAQAFDAVAAALDPGGPEATSIASQKGRNA